MIGSRAIANGMRRRPRLVFAGLYALTLTAVLVAFATAGAFVLQQELEAHTRTAIAEVDGISQDVLGTMAVLGNPPAVAPCSEPFFSWLREVAFRPDRINEILYAPNGKVACSIGHGKFAEPVALGPPQFSVAPHFPDNAGKIRAYDVQLWNDFDPHTLDFPDRAGWLLGFKDFVLVFPNMQPLLPIPGEVSYEVVWRNPSGALLHHTGTPGLYVRIAGISTEDAARAGSAPEFSASACSTGGASCLAISEPVLPLVQRFAPLIAGAVALAAALAGAATVLLKKLIERSWSLTSRVRRHLSADTITCLYQPLLDLGTDQVAGIEVLARWRDDDGSLVSPLAFLPIVEKYALQRKLTRLVVDRAYRDLSGLIAGPRPLLVHFNIFPIDFDPDWMIELFSAFLADSERFTVVIELVESDMLPIERTRDAIARLKQAGILTYIDDFGEGYSSIGYLASLGTHGVKLDRSFGMAPEGSLMDTMMSSAIEMVAKTGQVLVVEGVETLWRLASLKANGNVAMAQGYYISRPVDVVRLGPLLSESPFVPKSIAA